MHIGYSICLPFQSASGQHDRNPLSCTIPLRSSKTVPFCWIQVAPHSYEHRIPFQRITWHAWANMMFHWSMTMSHEIITFIYFGKHKLQYPFQFVYRSKVQVYSQCCLCKKKINCYASSGHCVLVSLCSCNVIIMQQSLFWGYHPWRTLISFHRNRRCVANTESEVYNIQSRAWIPVLWLNPIKFQYFALSFYLTPSVAERLNRLNSEKAIVFFKSKWEFNLLLI